MARAAAERRFWVDSGWVFGGGLLIRLAVVAWAWGRFPATADAVYYHRLATRLAAGQGYTWLWPDGAVTYAAHYPIGYPAGVAGAYLLAGPQVGAAMVLNALLGAMSALAVHRLLLPLRSRRVALLGGALVAAHPALVAYTPALMTEGVTAACLACAGWAAVAARQHRPPSARHRWLLVAAVGALLGVATLVRPQSILLAPLFGMVAAGPGWRRRLGAAALVTAVTLTVCAPWTVRNCCRMGRCALVSVNAGWNLLIGTDPAGRGGWAPLQTPAACREVFDEAAKDRCFEGAAWQTIRAAPVPWLALAPAKLAVTFDYCGAGGWYLHASNPQEFSHRSKTVLGVIETVYQRLVLLFALVAVWPGQRARRRWPRRLLVAAGVASCFMTHAWLGYVALAGALALRRSWLLGGNAHGLCLGVLLSMLATHAVFFGAGRYGMVVFPLLCALAATSLGRWPKRAAQSS